MSFLSRYFVLSDHHTPQTQVPNWRVSTLRIIITSGILLCLMVFAHASSTIVEFKLAYPSLIIIGFLATMFLLLLTSYRFYTFSAHGLLLSIIAGSALINLFVSNLELAQVGSMYMYACPILALMLLGFRTALFYSLLNIVPFYIIINDINLLNLINTTERLPNDDLYVTGLIFLLFNICIPLALARTILAAKHLNKAVLSSNTYLKDKNALYRTFFAESNKAKVIINNKSIITDFNQLAASTFKFTDKIKESNSKLHRFFPELDQVKCKKSKHLIKYKNANFYVTCESLPDSNYEVYEFTDCTEELEIRKTLINMEQENKRLRYYDNYTNLPNRDWFELQCERVMAKYNKDFYVVLTHSASNEYFNLKFNKKDANFLLTSAYKRLKSNTEGPLLCAHIGPGRLAFIIRAQSIKELKTKLLTEIKQTLDEAYPLSGSKCHQSFLFGFAKYDDSVKNSAKVISNANTALKQANINTPFSGYSETFSKEFLEKYEISMLLDEALQNAELDVAYQPKVTANGLCIGLEALARWNSPILGSVEPSSFVAIAEEYKLISRLTDLVIQKVCSQISYWAQAGVTTVPVAINISLVDFNQADFLPRLVKYLADFNVKPEQIELELTETSLDANPAHSLKLMRILQSWGFIISVDDFGVGYSNIARLADYPINKLKLDRSLIKQITKSSRQKSLVKAIHVMCKELDIKCVAEGVETLEQVTIMNEMGCKEYQGFYFAKAMSAGAFSKHVKKFGLTFNNKKQTVKESLN
jgi:EAL domain-containing protein (putative c-di-GMP-specific phosphodiesterase class I)/GGDEF domain-containing protein